MWSTKQPIERFQHFGSNSFCDSQSDANKYLFHCFTVLTGQFMDIMNRIFLNNAQFNRNWVYFLVCLDWCGPKFHAALCHEPHRHPERGAHFWAARCSDWEPFRLQKWFCAAACCKMWIRVATWFFVHVVQDAAPLTHFGRNCLLEIEVKEAPVGLWFSEGSRPMIINGLLCDVLRLHIQSFNLFRAKHINAQIWK